MRANIKGNTSVTLKAVYQQLLVRTEYFYEHVITVQLKKLQKYRKQNVFQFIPTVRVNIFEKRPINRKLKILYIL